MYILGNIVVMYLILYVNVRSVMEIILKTFLGFPEGFINTV
jgi:hypothetical protein